MHKIQKWGTETTNLRTDFGDKFKRGTNNEKIIMIKKPLKSFAKINATL